jgi:CheY-like chemotaxis protein
MKTLSHKPKILIIEDNPHNHQLYRDAFEHAGFEVVLGGDADGLLPEAVHAVTPDIISMDLMLAKGNASAERDGFDAIEALKADPRTKHIPVIVLSNFSEESKVWRARELGAADFITAAGQPIQKVPEYFLRCLKEGEKYKPSHPIFRF